MLAPQNALLGIVQVYLAIVCVDSLAAEPATLLTIGNPDGLIEVIALNDGPLLVGRREARDSNGVLSNYCFVRSDGTDHPLPLPKSFTNVEALAVSQSDHIVGYAMRAPGNPEGNQRAVVWSTQGPELLPVPNGYIDGCGHDISRDGRRVSGIVLGRDPARIAPCLWEYGDDGWKPNLLLSPYEYNPLLVTSRVVISDDGRLAAASVVINLSEHDERDYGLFYWREDDRGDWNPNLMLNRAVHLANVNNAGRAVGRIKLDRWSRAYVYDRQNGEQILPLPEGHVSSRATGVNNQGQVVGYSEEPPGPAGVMTAFLWHRNQLARLPLPSGTELSSASWITDRGRVGGWFGQGDDLVEAYVCRVQPD